jgi:hypothetical protein
MQINTYQTIMNRTQTSSLKKYRTELESNWQKNLIKRTELELKRNRTPNELRIMNFTCSLHETP